MHEISHDIPDSRTVMARRLALSNAVRVTTGDPGAKLAVRASPTRSIAPRTHLLVSSDTRARACARCNSRDAAGAATEASALDTSTRLTILTNDLATCGGPQQKHQSITGKWHWTDT